MMCLLARDRNRIYDINPGILSVVSSDFPNPENEFSENLKVYCLQRSQS